MKNIFIISAFITLMLSCKTQKNLDLNYKDYQDQFSRIDQKLHEGYPEQALAALDSLIVDAKQRRQEQSATQAILRKINIKNLDLQDFAQNQVSYLEEELSLVSDSTSKSFLSYTLALVYKTIWEGNSNILPSDIKGDGNPDASMYKSKIDSLLNIAVLHTDKKEAAKKYSDFFTTQTYDDNITLKDFFLSEKIELYKSNVYTRLLSEKEQLNIVGSFYDDLISSCKSKGQRKLELEFTIDKFSYLDEDLDELEIEANDSLRFIIEYYKGIRLYQEAQRSLFNKEEASTFLRKAQDLFQFVKANGDSIYQANAQVYQDLILNPKMQINVENVVIPGQKSLIYLNYANLDKVYLRIYQLKKSDYIQQRYQREFPLDDVPIIHNIEIDLPKARYQFVEQSVEVEFPALDAGFYGVLISTLENFDSTKDNPLFKGSVLASNYTISNYFDNENQEFRLSCINRLTGEQVRGAKFTIYNRQFRRGNRGDKMSKVNEGLGNPEFAYTPERNSNLFPAVEFEDDYFMVQNALYYNDSRPRIYQSSKIYTDRSIYRPGQEVSFFGINYEVNEDAIPTLFGKSRFELTVSDNFGNEIEKISIETKDDGSFSGSFLIPDNVQNGNINLRINSSDNKLSGYHGIRVEEYKRPKFKIDFEEIESELRLGQNLEVNTIAMTYTGLPVRNAKLKYKVYRSYWWPYFYNGYRSYFPTANGGRTLILSGETTSDGEGRSRISFNTERSLTDPKIKNYSYTIEVEIINESGETQTNSKTLNISEQAIFTKFQEADNLGEYKLLTVNSENQAVEAQVDIKIYKQTDSDFKIKRYWPMPDTSIIETNDYPDYNFVPIEEIYDALEYENSIILKDTFKIDLHEVLGSGTFKVILKAAGEEAISQIIEINDFEAQSFGNQEVFYIDKIKDEYLIDDLAKIRLGSNIKDLEVQILKFKRNRLLENTFVKINKVLSISEVIDSSDYGGYSYLFRTYFKNRVYTKTVNIRVPWKEKQLTITPTSIRYISEPGAPEKWSFKVTDSEGKPVEARFLSSMYDASLDQFQGHNWQLNIYPNFLGVQYFNYNSYRQSNFYPLNYNWNRNRSAIQSFDIIPKFRFRPQQYNNYGVLYKMRGGVTPSPAAAESDAVMIKSEGMSEPSTNELSAPPPPPPSDGGNSAPPPPIRTNLSETVFFLPNLKTDKDGNVTFEFNNNDALSTWKLQNFSFTRELKFGFSSAEITTRKDLMIQANQPRFLRSGDKIYLAAKCFNLTEKEIASEAQLVVYDVLNKRTLNIDQSSKSLTLPASGEKSAFWEIDIPKDLELLKLTYVLRSENHNDAEEYIVQVHPNEKFLTDSRTVVVNSNDQNSISLVDLKEGNKRISALSIESSASPVWYAIQALPYLAESENENAEAIFNRYFANSLAMKILEENPLVERYYSAWQREGDLTSKLNLNKELKNIDIKQTPWLSRALSEEQVMNELAQFFDSKSLQKDLELTNSKLEEIQLSGGGFSWFEGGKTNYFISQLILEGITKLKTLGIEGFSEQFISSLMEFCNREAQKVYEKKTSLVPSIVLTNIWINQVLGMKNKKASWHALALKEVREKWPKYALIDQSLIAKIYNNEDKELAAAIAQSLMEKSYYKENLGRFWNLNESMVYSAWQIGLQSNMIILFNEIDGFEEEVEEMKFWLVNNKRTNSWSSSISTTSAIYALSLGSASDLREGSIITTYLDEEELESEIVSGVNYQKMTISDIHLISKTQEVSFKNPNEEKAYANVHLQYFQDYDDIKGSADQQLVISKEVYLIESDDKLSNITSKELELGDRVKVRLIFESDRPMQFVHISDDRPAGAEPVITTSGYQWGRNMSFYQSVKDTNTDFFIEEISKGQFVIEYDMFINNLGIFNSGIAQIQSYYAPEFNDHSKSIKFRVGE